MYGFVQAYQSIAAAPTGTPTPTPTKSSSRTRPQPYSRLATLKRMSGCSAAVIHVVCYALLVGVAAGANGQSSGQSQTEQQLQCYSCGLPKVHPENDMVGSYGTSKGKKMYNHTCNEMQAMMSEDGHVDNRFLRTCPVGVKSCFGATGFYDHKDDDPSNDLKVQFLGCSEAKHRHDYGCDREFQNVDIKDKSSRKIQVEIDVNLCFCSDNTCNHPDSELLSTTASAGRPRPSQPGLLGVLGLGLLLGGLNGLGGLGAASATA